MPAVFHGTRLHFNQLHRHHPVRVHFQGSFRCHAFAWRDKERQMRKLIVAKMFAVAAAMVVWSGASTAGAPVDKPRMHLLQDAEIKEIRISAIPDSDAKKVEEKCN